MKKILRFLKELDNTPFRVRLLDSHTPTEVVFAETADEAAQRYLAGHSSKVSASLIEARWSGVVSKYAVDEHGKPSL